MEKNNTAIYIIIVLFIGMLIGFSFGKSRVPSVANVSNGHIMADGTYMSNDGMSMAQMMADMNKSLMNKTGDEFDKAFLSEMIVHHEGAVEMAEMALKNAKHEEVIELSRAIITAQNKEIAQMKSWKNTWYGQGN